MSGTEKIKFTPFNPCKKCLKRPVCIKECKDLLEHSGTQECIVALSIFFGMIIATVVGIIFLAKFNKILLYFATISLVITYFYSTKSLIEDSSDLENMNFLAQLFIVIVNPWGVAATYIIDTFKLDDKIDKHVLRFKQNILERKYPSEVE
jgi:hypothetical protein